jgi:hypothetical protein
MTEINPDRTTALIGMSCGRWSYESQPRQIEKRVQTGAKNLANGIPPLRAKAQSCRDAAAMQAMQDAVKLMIIIAITKFVAARLPVAL